MAASTRRCDERNAFLCGRWRTASLRTTSSRRSRNSISVRPDHHHHASGRNRNRVQQQSREHDGTQLVSRPFYRVRHPRAPLSSCRQEWCRRFPRVPHGIDRAVVAAAEQHAIERGLGGHRCRPLGCDRLSRIRHCALPGGGPHRRSTLSPAGQLLAARRRERGQA